METDLNLSVFAPEKTSEAGAVTAEAAAFCPAASCAGVIVRLESLLAQLARLQAAAEPARSPAVMTHLEAVKDELLIAVDEARDRLAQAEPVSAAGAIAQLLAAVRDIRIRDEHECERAKDLEMRAVGFLTRASLYNPDFASALSQTKLGYGRRTHARAGREQLIL